MMNLNENFKRSLHSHASPFHRKRPCKPVMVSIGVITVLMMAKMDATNANRMAMETLKMVTIQKLNGIRLGLRRSSSLTENKLRSFILGKIVSSK